MKCFFHKIIFGHFFAILLMAIFEHGNREERPPNNGDDDRILDRHDAINPEIFAKGHKGDGKQKRNGATADIAHAKAPRGDAIHAVGSGHIGEEAIIEHARATKADMRENIAKQKPLPMIGKQAEEAENEPQTKKRCKQFFLHSAIVSHCAKQGCNNGGNRGRNRCAHTPPEITALPRSLTDARKIDGKNRDHHDGGIDRVCPIIENPTFFDFGKFHKTTPSKL